MRSSSSTQLSVPPRVALKGAGILFLYCALRDLRPTPATDTAAPRMRTSEARVTREAGEDIVVWGCRVGGVIKAGFWLDDLAAARCNCGEYFWSNVQSWRRVTSENVLWE